jgi:hypothetical protein
MPPMPAMMLSGTKITLRAVSLDTRGYQTLINQALHQAMQGEQIETTLRRVIREELAHREKGPG